MNKPRVALITFGDEREFEYNNLYKRLTEPRHELAIKALEKYGFEVISGEGIVRTKPDISREVAFLKGKQPDVLVAHLPCWVSPNMVCRAVELLGLPTVLVTNDSPCTHGTVGLLGAGGALDQIGFRHVRIRKEWDCEDQTQFEQNLVPYVKASAAKNSLRGTTFGLFGGRSLGIDTGTMDPMQWRAMFGVDTEHVDQSEILRLAPQIDADRVEKMRNFLSTKSKCITYDEVKLTPQKLDLQIRCYLATKDIVASKGLDFMALKCMPDMTVNHVAQCLSAAFMPAPFDGEGAKKVTPIACEADADAALTMMMLKELSNGCPTWFADVSHIDMDAKTIYFPNCGGMCAWYAARSACPEENMKNIEMRFANRPAGGASTFFIAAGGPVTLARLTRRSGKYIMTVFLGNMRTPSEQELKKWIEARGVHQLPTAYIDVDIDLDRLVDEFGSNHMAGVAGDCLSSLVRLCEFYKIPCEFLK